MATETMSKRDYYEVLGVERTATEVELKTSFRKLAMQHHPDRNPDDKQAELRFKEINEAYQILSDGQKRAAYDRFGHQAFAQGEGQGGAGFGPDFSDFMSDIFDTFFGDTRQRGRGQAPRARRRSARRSRDHPRGGLSGQDGDARRADQHAVRELRRLGREARRQAAQLRHLPRSRPGARHARLLLDRARLPDLPWSRTDDRQSLRRLRRHGPRDARAPALRQYSGGRRGRHAHQARGRGRCRRPGRGRPAISISSCPSSRMPSISGTAPISSAACRSPWSAPRSAARSPCRRSTAARPSCKIPEGAQSGKQFRLKGKGMPVLRSRDHGDLAYPGRGRDAAEPDPAPARAADRVRQGELERDATRIDRLLCQGEGFF